MNFFFKQIEKVITDNINRNKSLTNFYGIGVMFAQKAQVYWDLVCP